MELHRPLTTIFGKTAPTSGVFLYSCWSVNGITVSLLRKKRLSYWLESWRTAPEYGMVSHALCSGIRAMLKVCISSNCVILLTMTPRNFECWQPSWNLSSSLPRRLPFKHFTSTSILLCIPCPCLHLYAMRSKPTRLGKGLMICQMMMMMVWAAWQRNWAWEAQVWKGWWRISKLKKGWSVMEVTFWEARCSVSYAKEKQIWAETLRLPLFIRLSYCMLRSHTAKCLYSGLRLATCRIPSMNSWSRRADILQKAF